MTTLNAPAERKGMFIINGQNVLVTFMLVSSLFLLWGFLNGMIDVMDKHFQKVLHLTLSQSAWVQFAHYLGYFLMSLPAGWLATKLGWKGGIIAGLLMVSLGGFWFIPATQIQAFWAFLLGVCVIASGLTFLETVANPYTTVLGDPKYGATRINIAQSCNGIGWIFGPIVGGMFFYGKDASGADTGSQTLYIPYATVAVLVLVLVIVFSFSKLPDIKAEDDYHLDESDPAQTNAGADKDETAAERSKPLAYAAPKASRSIWSRPHFVMAVAAQFFYVAAQAGIFSFFINYMTSPEVPSFPTDWTTGIFKNWFEVKDGITHFSDQGAAYLTTVGFFCFLGGRACGSAILGFFSAHKTLALYGVINVLMCLLIFLKLGWISVAAIFLSYFFMSIMFPTIFALGIFGLGTKAKTASSFIVMAIMGGAVLPKFMGWIADNYGMSKSFIVPLFCFAFVALYGFTWSKLSGVASLHNVKTAGGH